LRGGEFMSARVIITLSMLLLAVSAAAQGHRGVEEANAEAQRIIEEAEREAAEIRRSALREAAEIEAEAVRKAAQIEAEAIRKAAQQNAGASAVPESAPSPFGQVRVRGDRFPGITGVWKWEGNARNRKFKLTQHEDGTVETELYTSPRTRHYREDLRYEDGKLLGKTLQTIRTPTGNDTKRTRDFVLEISRDGNQLVGTIVQWDETQNREEREDVTWVRVKE